MLLADESQIDQSITATLQADNVGSSFKNGCWSYFFFSVFNNNTFLW